MNRKTESLEFTEERKPRLFIEWCCAFVLAGFLFLLSMSKSFRFLEPWVTAGGVTIRAGMEEFVGHSAANTGSSDRYYMLMGLLVAFVIAPTLFLFAWRKIRVEGLPQSFLATLLFIAGGSVTLSVFVPSVPEAVSRRLPYAQTGETQTIQETKENLMLGLNEIGVDARAYWILPEPKGGGNKSFAGYRIPVRFAGSGDVKYEIAPAEGRTLRFKASSRAYAGSSVMLELDSTSLRFTYDGIFTP